MPPFYVQKGLYATNASWYGSFLASRSNRGRRTPGATVLMKSSRGISSNSSCCGALGIGGGAVECGMPSESAIFDISR